MFENFGHRAEQIATRLPRRAFFGKVAQAAVPIAAALGSYLVLTSGPASAIGPRKEVKWCCKNPSTGAVVCRRRIIRFSIAACPDGFEEADCPKAKQELPVCEA
jgi:hypothetical protein